MPSLYSQAQFSRHRIRGFMIDAARLVEKMSYYHRLIDFAGDWGVNTILLRLTDDQGCALRFVSHPELATHPHALTPVQAGELVRHAGKRGIDLIPEIESFGHAGFITRCPRHAELSDTNPDHPHFNGLCPVHPRTLALFQDLYRESARIFPSRYLHGGCDEVNWGGSQLSQAALKTKSRSQIWSEYLNALHGSAQKCGRELMVWADHILRKEPGILPLLEKEIILVDWDYWSADPKEVEKYARQALAAGLRVVGGPALNWCKWGPRIGTTQLENIDAFVETYRYLDDPKCLGLIVTNWVPARYCQGAAWDGLAYAAVAMNEGRHVARQQAWVRFVEQHFAAPWDATWSDVFRSLYDLAPVRHGCGPAWVLPALPLPWHDEKTLAAVLRQQRGIDPPFTRLRAQLVQCQRTVRRNHEDFESLLLTVEYLEYLFWRESAVVAAARNPTEKTALALLSATIARRDRQIVAGLIRDWNLGRTEEDGAGRAVVPELSGPDQLLHSMRRAAAFTTQLARQPHRLGALLARLGKSEKTAAGKRRSRRTGAKAR